MAEIHMRADRMSVGMQIWLFFLSMKPSKKIGWDGLGPPHLGNPHSPPVIILHVSISRSFVLISLEEASGTKKGHTMNAITALLLASVVRQGKPVLHKASERSKQV